MPAGDEKDRRVWPAGWRVVRLVGLLTVLNVKSRLEYRVDFLVWLFVGIAWQLSALAFVWVVIAQFGGMGGWTKDQILLLAGIRILVHALYTIFFDNLGQVATLIRLGAFDRFLLRPVNPLLQVLTLSLPLNGLGDLAVGLALLGTSLARLGVDWSLLLVLFTVLCLAGGVLLEAAIHLAIASTSFWLVGGRSVDIWIDEATNTFGNYPLAILPAPLQALFTFAIPIAFLAYFPASVLLGKVDEVPFSPLLAYGSPVVGVAAFALAYLAWTRAIRFYKSVGA